MVETAEAPYLLVRVVRRLLSRSWHKLHIQGRREFHRMCIELLLYFPQCIKNWNDIAIAEHVRGNKMAMDLEGYVINDPRA